MVAYFLILGRSWARWFAILGGLLATVGASVRLGSAGELHEDVQSVRSLLLMSTVLYGAVALVLTLSPSARAFFHSRRTTLRDQRTVVREWDRVFGLTGPAAGSTPGAAPRRGGRGGSGQRERPGGEDAPS